MNPTAQETLKIAATGAGFNLAAAIANLANPSGVVAGYTRDLLRWLERSGVDETNFERCMTAAQGLAYPNKNGMMLSQSVTRADRRLLELKQGQLPLGLTFSQALGRLIVKEPEVCYMASTTASLLTHHDISYTTSALTSMVLDRGGHQTETKYIYEVWRAPIKAVISKLVESIFLNISNPGHKTESFPPELAQLHVHLVDDTNFAAIVMQIRRTCNDLVFQADRFPGDVILWLLNHFEGYLEIYVKSAKYYEAKLGVDNRKITAIIKETCSDDHETCDGRSWPVVLAEVVDGKPRRLVGGSSSEDLKPCSYQRQNLYTTKNLMTTAYASFKTSLKGEQHNEIKHTARRITKWLIHVPINVTGWNQLAGFCFKSELELDEDRDRSREFTIAQLLFRSPRLLQESTGESTDSAPIFRRPPWQGSPMSSQNTDPEQWGSNTTPEEVLKNFPSAEGMLENMRKSCKCPNCQSNGSLSNSKRNCLRYSAVLELCILISHAVVDALGGDDVSGAPEPEDARSGVISLLLEIIDQEIVRWDTWFKVAACAVTGCSWELFVDVTGDSGDEGGTSWVGVQYGSLAVLAPWLDFYAPLDIEGSFWIHIFEGNIQGVKDDVALIQTEKTSASLNDEIDRMDIVEDVSEKLVEIDDTSFVVQKALFRAENSVHRLLVIVTVNDHLRIIDPTRAVMTLSRSQQAVCKHRRSDHTPKTLHNTLPPNSSINARNFEAIFTQWAGIPELSSTNENTSVDVSIVIDDLRKLFISLALSGRGVILRNTQRCCVPCALQKSLDSRTATGFNPILSFDNLPRRHLIESAHTQDRQ